jgi:hypothetical protein
VLAATDLSRGRFETNSEDGSALSCNDGSPVTSSSGQQGAGIGRHALTSIRSIDPRTPSVQVLMKERLLLCMYKERKTALFKY